MNFHSHISRRASRAFTLAEFMIALGISGILLTAVASLSLYSGRSLASMVNYVELNQKSRHALDAMTREIRQADRLLSASSSPDYKTLIFDCHDEAGDAYTNIFEWFGPDYATDPTLRGKLNMHDSRGNSYTLLTDCESFDYVLYTRGVTGTNYQLATTVSEANCKLVQVKWECARYVLGMSRKTESVQTAKIGMRKQVD